MNHLAALLILTDPLDWDLRSVATDCVGAIATAVGAAIFKVSENSLMSAIFERYYGLGL